MAFSLEKFESLAYGRNREMGVRELLALLQDLDANYGQVGAQFKAQPCSLCLERHGSACLEPSGSSGFLFAVGPGIVF